MEYQAFHRIPWQHGAFWVAVAIVIFAVLFADKIVRPVVGMLDARTRAVQEALDEAARLKAEAEAMLADAKTRQAQAEADARQILESAHDEAARMAADLAREAEATARWRETLAMERIAGAEKAAIADIRAAAIDIATTATSQIIRNNYAPVRDAAAVDQAIAGVPAALRSAV
jgi:F-type H+-transporting ATPase subunit b